MTNIETIMFWIGLIYLIGAVLGLSSYVLLQYYIKSFCTLGDITLAFLVSWLSIIAIVINIFESFWREHLEDIVVIDFRHKGD